MITPALPGFFSSVDLGIRRGTQALDHAERVEDGWSARACALVVEFKRTQSDPWLMEQAVSYAQQQGLPRPPDKRAWGAIVKGLERAKRITRVPGQFRPDSYGSPKALWM